MTGLTLLTMAATALLAPPRLGNPTATVALVAELPAPGARAAVLRRAAGDVILLARGDATRDDLAAALALLAAVRQRDGAAPPERDVVLIVKSSQLAAPLDKPRRQRLEAHLARLRAARPRLVDGVGTVPAIELPVRAPVRSR